MDKMWLPCHSVPSCMLSKSSPNWYSCTTWPVDTSQSLHVLSPDAEISCVLSGLKQICKVKTIKLELMELKNPTIFHSYRINTAVVCFEFTTQFQKFRRFFSVINKNLKENLSNCTMQKPINQSIDRLDKQTINQSINQSIYRKLCQSKYNFPIFKKTCPTWVSWDNQ